MITGEGKIAVLVYKEDHPEAYPPEISEATGVDYMDVVHTLREHAASNPVYEVKVNTQYKDKAVADRLASMLRNGRVEAEVVDVTPCAFRVNHGPGHQSETYCEKKGPHEHHGMDIMGTWEEFDQEGNHVY